MATDLSYDVVSGSDKTPCIKIDKPHIVMLCNDLNIGVGTGGGGAAGARPPNNFVGGGGAE